MEHTYEYDGCAPSVANPEVIVEQWRKFWEERPTRNNKKYLVHHEEFVQRLDDNSYRKCSYVTEWQLLPTGSENSNSRIDYILTEAIDPAILMTDTNPTWEYVRLV